MKLTQENVNRPVTAYIVEGVSKETYEKMVARQKADGFTLREEKTLKSGKKVSIMERGIERKADILWFEEGDLEKD